MIRNLSVFLLGLVLFFIVAKTYPQSLLVQTISTGYDLTEQGVVKNDKKLLLHARAILEQASVAVPDNPYVTYALGYSEYRLCAYAFGNNDDNLFDQYADSTITRMEKIESDSVMKSEASAVLGGVYGMKIAKNFMKSPFLGPKSHRYSEEAVNADSTNPRAWLFLGQSQLGSPAFFGGSSIKAAESFASSVSLAEKKLVRDSLAPRWGLLDALIWSGRAAEANNDLTSAVKFYHRVLEIEPEHGWVKYRLLPDAEQKLAAKK